MDEARGSISETVAEIKDTVEEKVESVKETVAGVTEWREQFQKEPLVWSLGALAAGFALGYTLGYAHENTKTGRKRSEIARFADSIVDELSTVGQGLVMPRLNSQIKQLFGFDLSDLLGEIGADKKRRPTRKRSRKPATKRTATKKGGSKKRD
jgi:hypothetical protein